MTPALIDHRGQPLRKEVLTEEIGGPTLAGVRSPISGYPADGMTPIRLANILRQADQGDPLAYFELAEQIEERDPHYRNKTKPLIGPSGRLGKEIAKLVTRDSVEIGSDLEYSGVMQNGAAKGAFGKGRNGRPVPWGDIPARVWLGISAEDEKNILDIVDEHLAAAIGGGDRA